MNESSVNRLEAPFLTLRLCTLEGELSMNAISAEHQTILDLAILRQRRLTLPQINRKADKA